MYFEKYLFYRENLPLAFVHSFFPDFLKGLLLQVDDVGFLTIQPVNKENKKIQQGSVRWLNLEL